MQITIRIILFCTIFQINALAQTDTVKLLIDYNFENKINFKKKSIKLKLGKEVSLCTIISETRMGGVVKKDKNNNLTKADNYLESVKISKKYMYKDYIDNSLLYLDYAFGTESLVKDSLSLFKWTITNKQDTLLGYICKEAETTFRGRDYVAYFTTELNFKGSPWKFHGLPGVTLKVFSKDDFIKIEATSLKIQNDITPITNPFKNNNSLTWQTFTDLYKKKHKEFDEKYKAMCARINSTNTTFYDPRIEIIIDLNRKLDR